MKTAPLVALLALAACGGSSSGGPSEEARKAYGTIDELRQLVVEYRDLGERQSKLGDEAAKLENSATEAERTRVHKEIETVQERLRTVVGSAKEKMRFLDQTLDQFIAARPKDGHLLDARSQFRELMAGLGAEGDLVEQALKDAEEALKLLPGDAPLRIRRANLLRKVSRYDEAATELAAAGSADPAAKAVRALLAYATGEPAAAVAALEEALKDKDRTTPSLVKELEETLKMAKPGVDQWAQELKIREAEKAKDDLPRVKLVTEKGDVVVELFENEAPNAVANFIELCGKGFYDGTKFHRIVGDFMVQGGDPNSRDADPANDGQGGPGYSFKDELGANYRRHFRGSLSMANGGPDTNGSQFFITVRPTQHLDGKHVVFGRVLEGMEVVHKLAKGDALKATLVLRKRDHPYRPTVD